VATPHMARYREDTDPMIAQRSRTLCRLLTD
jgi:hypothetical protein